jgi:hypothetical protein
MSVNRHYNFSIQNVNKSEAEKISKHKDFTVEIQRMWNFKTKVTRACSTNSNHRTAALFYRAPYKNGLFQAYNCKHST